MVNDHVNVKHAPVGVVQSIENLNTFAALLKCQDAAKLNTHGGPTAQGVAGILYCLTGELESALSEVVKLPH